MDYILGWSGIIGDNNNTNCPVTKWDEMIIETEKHHNDKNIVTKNIQKKLSGSNSN